MEDPNAALAATVVAHLLEAGLIREEDRGAVGEALATGRVGPDEWTRWMERGREAKGA